MKPIKTIEVWKEHACSFHKSGLLINMYSKESNLKPTIFRYWVGKFTENSKTKDLVKVSPTKFYFNCKIKLHFNSISCIKM